MSPPVIDRARAWAARVPDRWWRAIALVTASFLLTAYAWWPMLAAYPHAAIGDAQSHQAHLEAARMSIVHYHEFPLWNPYECNGLPLWDNPQSLSGSPLVWPSILIGSTRTLQIWILFHVAAAFAGMWILARRELKLGYAATFVAAGTWAYCGFHQHHQSGGHLTFAAYAYFPIALYMWRRAEGDLRHAVGLGALVAWMFYEGSGYPIPHFMLILGAETLTRLRPVSRIPRILRATLVVGLVAFTVSAARLLPVLDQIRHHTRQIDPDVDALKWDTFVDMFLARAHGRGVPGQQYVWTEFGSYIGVIIAAFAILGILLGGYEYGWLVFLLIVSIGFLLGHEGEYAPWHLVHKYVPPFKEMRVPGRFRSFVLVFLAAFAGIAVDRITKWKWLRSPSYGTLARGTVIVIALLGVGDIISVGLTVIEPFFHGPIQGKPAPSTHFFYNGPNMAPYMDLPMQNRGRSECYDEWGFGAGAPIWSGDVLQARAQDGGAVVEGVERTQNTFTIDVDAKQPTRILVNTAYDRGWRTDVGTALEQNKQLVIDVPAGSHQLHLRYWPIGFTAGIVITILGSIGSIAFLMWDAKKRRALATAT